MVITDPLVACMPLINPLSACMPYCMYLYWECLLHGQYRSIICLSAIYRSIICLYWECFLQGHYRSTIGLYAIYLYWECFLQGHYRSTIGLYAIYLYWECFLYSHYRSTIGLYATLLLLTGTEPLPYDSRPGAQVKGELHVALSQGQSDEVTLPVVRVAIVQNEAIHGLRFDDGFQLCEDQNCATKPLKLQVRVAVEMWNPHRCFCNKHINN